MRTDKKVRVISAAVHAALFLGYMTGFAIVTAESLWLVVILGAGAAGLTTLMVRRLMAALRLREEDILPEVKASRLALAEWTLSNLNRSEDVKAKMLGILNGTDTGEEE